METLADGTVDANKKLNKNKIIIVGGFPKENSQIFGGIVTSCKSLIDSSLSSKFNIITIDSTQKSNPIPHFLVRLIYAAKRTFIYFYKILFYRPKVVILFPAIGASLFEKGVMSWIAFFFRIPIFMFPRGGPLLDQVNESLLTKLLVRFSFAGATKVLCQGPSWKKFAMEDLNFSNENTPIIYNWTASDKLLEIGRTKLENFHPKNLNFLYLGWLEEEKGIFDFLNAFKDLGLNSKSKIFIAGGGSCEEKAKAFVNQNNMSHYVNFKGWVTGDELEDLFKITDVLILPSWAEGFPNAVIEAMASGLAVIVSEVGNVPDILTNESEAILIKPKDRHSLKNAIIKVSEDLKLRESISKNGYHFAAKNFYIEEAVLKLEKLIKKVSK